MNGTGKGLGLVSDLVAQVPCPRCEAKAGQGCTTITGAPYQYHTARCNPLLDAFRLGREVERNAQRVAGLGQS